MALRCWSCDADAPAGRWPSRPWWTITGIRIAPQVFALLNLVYRDQLFPREAYRHSWEALLAALPPRLQPVEPWSACSPWRTIAPAGELAIELEAILGTGELPDLALLRQQFAPPGTVVPTVTVTLPAACTYDALPGSPQEWLRP